MKRRCVKDNKLLPLACFERVAMRSSKNGKCKKGHEKGDTCNCFLICNKHNTARLPYELRIPPVEPEKAYFSKEDQEEFDHTGDVKRFAFLTMCTFSPPKTPGAKNRCHYTFIKTILNPHTEAHIRIISHMESTLRVGHKNILFEDPTFHKRVRQASWKYYNSKSKQPIAYTVLPSPQVCPITGTVSYIN